MFRAVLISLMLTGAARAEGIVVDLPIVGALVGSVTDAPVTVLAEGQSDPHGLSLRPSQARALADADLVVHLGSGLSPALERAIADAGVPQVSLSDLAKGLHADHGDDDDGEHDHDDDHHRGGADPHVWLDYRQIDTWLAGISDALMRNGIEPLATVDLSFSAEIAAELAADLQTPLPRVLTAHDSWSHLTDALQAEPFAAIADSHAAAPGARHMAALRDRLDATGADCILVAPGDPLAQAEALSEDYDLTIVTTDPQGDPALSGLARYRSIFTGFAEAMAACQAKPM